MLALGAGVVEAEVSATARAAGLGGLPAEPPEPPTGSFFGGAESERFALSFGQAAPGASRPNGGRTGSSLAAESASFASGAGAKSSSPSNSEVRLGLKQTSSLDTYPIARRWDRSEAENVDIPGTW